MIAILRSRCARIWRPCARLLGLLALWGVLAPASGWAQLAPEYFSIDPAAVELGECYTIDVGTPDITLDVEYSLDGGSNIILYGWPSIGSDGTAEICTSLSTATGAYIFVAARNALGGDWVSGGDSLTVTAPPPPDFSITGNPGSRSVEPGESATYTVAVTAVNGFSAAIGLSASGLPSGVRASFSSTSLTSPYTASSRLTLTASASASLGTTTVTVTGAGGGLSRTASVDLDVEPSQPTSFRINSTGGYAGVDTMVVTVGNGANMSLDLRYTLNGAARTGTIQLDARGRWSQDLAHNLPTGTYAYTGMKNALASDWVSISATYRVYPPQPTSMSVSPSSITTPATYTFDVSNGAGMSLDLRYTLNGARTGTIQLDASGRWSQDLAHNLPTGTYAYTEMKNALASIWVDIPDVSYTVHPPQPTSMSVSPGSIDTGESYRFNVGNGAGVTLDVQYTLTVPGGTTGTVQTIENWPTLVSAGGTRPDDGTVSIFASGCTLPGVYQFTAARNTRNSPWVTVTPDSLTLRAPVSVTSAAPSAIPAGTSATVTLTGENLCGLTLTTDYPGVSFSGLVFDPSTGAGTSATVLITVDPTAAQGVAAVTVSAGEGTATFDLTIGPRPDFGITASPVSHSVGPTGSADYSVSVTPVNGFSAAVGLSVSSMLPSGVTASFSPISLAAPDSASTLTLTTAGAGLGTTTVTVTGAGLGHGLSVRRPAGQRPGRHRRCRSGR